MIDAASKSARAVAVTAVFGAAIAHSTMNFRFGLSLSHDPIEQYVLAGFGVCVDIAKVFALAFAAIALEKARWLKGAACLLLWASTVAYSGAAALGFAALSRDTVVASRSSDVDDYKAAVSDKKRLTEQLEKSRENPHFLETYGCTEYNKNATKGDGRKKAEFCSNYWRSDQRLDDIKPAIKGATLTQSDPQTALMAKVFDVPRETVAIALALFLAIVAEIVSSLGTWVFSRSSRKPVRRDEAETQRQRPKLVVSN